MPAAVCVPPPPNDEVLVDSPKSSSLKFHFSAYLCVPILALTVTGWFTQETDSVVEVSICFLIFKVYFIDYAATVVSFPSSFIPLCPESPLLPALPTLLSSCSWVVHISSLASPFPILLVLTSPYLFCTYHLCFLFPVPACRGYQEEFLGPPFMKAELDRGRLGYNVVSSEGLRQVLSLDARITYQRCPKLSWEGCTLMYPPLWGIGCQLLIGSGFDYGWGSFSASGLTASVFQSTTVQHLGINSSTGGIWAAH